MGFTTFLRGGTVTQLRGLAFFALSETGYILAGSITSDGGGGGTTTWGTTGTVACRIYPLATTGVSRFVGGAINEESTHMVRMPAGATITLENRIVVGSRGTFDVLMAPERTDQPTTRVVEVIQI